MISGLPAAAFCPWICLYAWLSFSGPVMRSASGGWTYSMSKWQGSGHLIIVRGRSVTGAIVEPQKPIVRAEGERVKESEFMSFGVFEVWKSAGNAPAITHPCLFVYLRNNALLSFFFFLSFDMVMNVLYHQPFNYSCTAHPHKYPIAFFTLIECTVLYCRNHARIHIYCCGRSGP